ncbi:hypothetical protein YC2023_017891 [Brassica napus]
MATKSDINLWRDIDISFWIQKKHIPRSETGTNDLLFHENNKKNQGPDIPRGPQQPRHFHPRSSRVGPGGHLVCSPAILTSVFMCLRRTPWTRFTITDGSDRRPLPELTGFSPHISDRRPLSELPGFSPHISDFHPMPELARFSHRGRRYRWSDAEKSLAISSRWKPKTDPERPIRATTPGRSRSPERLGQKRPYQSDAEKSLAISSRWKPKTDPERPIRATTPGRSRSPERLGQKRPYQSDAEKSLAISSRWKPKTDPERPIRATTPGRSRSPERLGQKRPYQSDAEKSLAISSRWKLRTDPERPIRATTPGRSRSPERLGQSDTPRSLAFLSHDDNTMEPERPLAATQRGRSRSMERLLGATSGGRSHFHHSGTRERVRSDLSQRHSEVAPEVWSDYSERRAEPPGGRSIFVLKKTTKNLEKGDLFDSLITCSTSLLRIVSRLKVDSLIDHLPSLVRYLITQGLIPMPMSYLFP